MPIDQPIAIPPHHARYHEMLWRFVASLVCAPASPTVTLPCRRRVCRRNLVCSGAMRPSAALLLRSGRLQQLGLSAPICTSLPCCLAGADQQQFEQFDREAGVAMDQLRQTRFASWSKLGKALRLIRRQDRIAAAASPSTEGERP